MIRQNGVLPTVAQVLSVPTTLGELNGMTVTKLDSLLQFYAGKQTNQAQGTQWPSGYARLIKICCCEMNCFILMF